MGLWKRLMQRLRPEPIRMWPEPPAPRTSFRVDYGIMSTRKVLRIDEVQQLRDDWKNRRVSCEQFAADHGMKWTGITGPR